MNAPNTPPADLATLRRENAGLTAEVLRLRRENDALKEALLDMQASITAAFRKAGPR